MSEIVFILGAGASQDAGAPVMATFLDEAERVLADDPSLKMVVKAVGSLQGVLAKASFDISNIESIFGAIEMGRLIGKFPGFEERELEDLSRAVHHIIAATLMETILFDSDSAQIRPTTTYSHFAKILEHLNQSTKRASVITFNYDLALDYALQFSDQRTDYCLERPHRDGMRLLKLHGSLNWAKCSECGKIIVAEKLFKNHVALNCKLKLNMERDLKKLVCCGKPVDPSPVLVPPTWNKTQHHEHLRNVWKQAAEELSNAQQINVCGYSLPETDSFFAYLFALGSQGMARLRRVTVYDPDRAVEERFRKLLGTHIKMQYQSEKFSKAVQFISQEFVR